MQAKHAKPNKLALRVLSTAAVMAMVTSIAAPAFADAYGIAEYKTWYVSDGNISVDGKLVTITDSTGAVIHQETDDDPDGITITGKSNTNNVTLKDTTVTISDLEIDASETGKAAISSNGKTIIELDDNNVLTGGKDHAALEKESHATNNAANPNYTLTITDSNNNGKLTAKGGENGAGIGGAIASSVGGYADNITITGGTIEANAGKGDAAGIGNGANDAVDTTVTINANDNELNVAATTRSFGEAITGESTLTMANLGNEHSGVVRSYRKGWIFTYLNNTVHNGKYVGMEDNNQDLHQEDDAHTWGRSQIIKYATPDEQGTIRHYCSVDGCKGYYDEPYDYVEPSPDEPTPVTPVTPVTPDETPDSTPADDTTTPAEDITVTPADVADTAQDETAAVTPAGAQSTVQADTASTLPQTGVNWLAALASALSGVALLTAGLFLNRKESKH